MKTTHIKNAPHPRGTGRRSLVTLLAMMVLTLPVTSWAAVAVVVSADSNLSSLSQDAVENLFLGKKKTLPDGTTAIPVNQAEKTSIYDEFNTKVLKRPSAKVLQYWTRKVFSGKGKPPSSVDGDQAVIDHVTSTRGGIGYIKPSSVNSRVKVVLEVK